MPQAGGNTGQPPQAYQAQGGPQTRGRPERRDDFPELPKVPERVLSQNKPARTSPSTLASFMRSVPEGHGILREAGIGVDLPPLGLPHIFPVRPGFCSLGVSGLGVVRGLFGVAGLSRKCRAQTAETKPQERKSGSESSSVQAVGLQASVSASACASVRQQKCSTFVLGT